ncbi:MAG: hypothetical protein IAF38_10590 [Bacteroidia bacterium]|nr:hypothetical protein [Bacteroidia bacterium]
MRLPGFIFCFAILFFSANAQNKTPFLKPYWASISGGATMTTGFPVDSSVFFSLAKKDDPALHPNLDGYIKETGNSFDANSEFTLAMAFKTRKKDGSGYRERSVFRLGLTYSSGAFLSSSYQYTKAIRIDTLTSSSGASENIYIDSVFNYNYNFSYQVRQLGLEASLLFNTNPEKIIGLYGGFSFAEHISIKNEIEIDYMLRKRLRQTNTSGTSIGGGNGFGMNNEYGGSKYDGTYNTVAAKNSFSTRIAIPVGATLKLAKTKKFWKNFQLFFESKPSLDLTIVPGYKTFIRPRFSVQGGVRVLVLTTPVKK